MSDARRRRVRSLVCVVLAAGCAGRLEAAARDDLRAAEGALAEREPDQEAGQPAPMDVAAGEGLAGYTRLALAHHPALHAAFARWKASVLRIARARRLPEPTLAFGVFVRSVETRVGPQRARFSLRQSFPWPTRLTAGADAAAAEARALQRRFDATALEVAARVAEAYWELWETRAARALHREHVALFRAVADSLRGRLATGTAMLAELQQVDLAAARMDDVV
ncbi:MAG: TolC family protein, partial [Myxococcota bacterium]